MKQLSLIIIIVFAVFLRFWNLGSYPDLNADEAAIGYNAWSLIETGADEHGNPWPIHFQSFNDFKPGLYFYIVLPFVKFLGLNVWAVRIPGALLGVGTVLIIYFLVSELFRTSEKKVLLALTSSFFLAISPWHIHFSRGGWEVNIATFFITLGVYLFLLATRKQSYKSFALCILIFSLSLYTYHAARVVVPLLGASLIIIHKKEFLRNSKKAIVVAVIGVILLTPLAYDLTKGNVLSRVSGVGLFADPGPLNRINEQRGEHQSFLGLPAKLSHNKAVNYGLAFIDNWGKHFWGEFLFLSGDVIERNRVPETGQMYLHDLLFVTAGLIFVIFGMGKSDNAKGFRFVLSWLIIAPVASALTFQSPHALRAQNMVIPLVILSAYGLVSLSFWLHKLFKVSLEQNKTKGGKGSPHQVWAKRALDFVFIIFILFVSWNFTRYLHMYWVHMAKEYPFSSQYGLSELVEFIEEKQDEFENVVVTDRYDQPYILFLFYMKYPPKEFQGEHVLTPRDQFGFSTVREFGKYKFVEVDWDTTQPDFPNSLIAGTDEEIPDEANVIKEIYGSNGYKYFDVVAN